jgi:hypothetical protein
MNECLLILYSYINTILFSLEVRAILIVLVLLQQEIYTKLLSLCLHWEAVSVLDCSPCVG